MFGIWANIYLGLFVFGAGFLLLQVMMGQFGDSDIDSELDGGLDMDGHFDGHVDVDGHFDGDGHSHGDFDVDVDHTGHHVGVDVPFLTPLVITPMLAGTGVIGLLLTLGFNWPFFLHLPLALVGGFAVGYAVFYILAKLIAPMQGSSEVRVNQLWGTVGKVITSIPANRMGEIRFIANGAYVSYPARSATGQMLARGQKVIIEKVENSVAFVRSTE
jgi:hypothetical protein